MTKFKVGDKAPDFEGLDQDGNIHKLNDYIGKKLVIFFFPKASTPGCTAQAKNLSENYQEFEAKNYRILGISADSQERQAKFKDKYEMPFPLIADEDKKILEAYDVWGEKKFMGKTFDGIKRTTFVIDESGNIEDIITAVKTKEHTAQILK
ncbi:thioredoxin-dependent thiol peroxidase [Flavobacterium ardleyense]|uniref:thioredoxin-dependent thiol peroxidase n=1 Tax=Flavobacterium ardleyense TaxID=2038737 RepID=UPI00298CB3C4|nr:thioredoxin-dependent thiol peroxidase [Flavobacterium ardleyense]